MRCCPRVRTGESCDSFTSGSGNCAESRHPGALGKRTEYLWCILDVVEHVWRSIFYWISMIWNIYGISMEHLWNIYVCWFINPENSIVTSTTNHGEIGVMFTNLVIWGAPHCRASGYWRTVIIRKAIGKQWENHRNMEIYTVVMCDIAIENGL